MSYRQGSGSRRQGGSNYGAQHPVSKNMSNDEYIALLEKQNQLKREKELYSKDFADKPAALLHIVQEVLPPGSTTIVFIATKHRVEYLLLLLEAVRV